MPVEHGKLSGPYKRAIIAAPQRLLRPRRNSRAAMHEMECGSSCALRQLQIWRYLSQCTIWGCRSSPGGGGVEFSLPQRRNISSFIPSPFGLTLNSFHNSQFVKVTNVQSRGKVECAKKKLWQPTNKMHLIYFYDYSYDLNTRKKSDWKIIIYPSPSLNNRLKVQYSKILPVILQRGSYHDDKV